MRCILVIIPNFNWIIICAFKLFEGWKIFLNLDSLQGAFWEGRKALAPQALTVFKADRAYDMNDLSKVTDDSSYKEVDNMQLVYLKLVVM